ncbi:15231_t:CDS:2 [Acaulospora morrowiae]|uniref:15231_t:CDS:1 n=1 Tax=Acaulospora morrowiae TaxID=94023 RepID=A0A9N9BFC2_9GLOM|nr:15231_t:CDS:2 [Acaulospora morrowiae]
MENQKNGIDTLYKGFLEPLNFMKPQPKDLTYGRASIPYSPEEKVLREEPYICTEHNLPFPTSDEPEGFVYYQAWSLPTASKQRNTDIIYVHGLNEYGGRFSEFAIPILEQGFRIIALDLPSFGRSSGLHAFFKNWLDLIEAVHCVVNHVKQTNENENKKRNLILYGCSMGGMVVASCAIKYPDTFDAFGLSAPLVYVEEESRPSKFLETVADVLNKTPLGRMPIAEANRGKNSSDPTVEEKFLADPLTYHGDLRVSTGLTLRDGIEWLQSNLGNITKPFLVQHGMNDRATQVKGSRELFDKSQTPEDKKVILLYEDCEHEMFRDPVAGKKVLSDAINWMVTTDERLCSS